FELGGERLLLLTIAPLRVPAQIVDKLERAVFGAATAQRDEGIRARQIVERVDDEGCVAGVRDRHLLAQKIAHVDPELVGEQIGVGDDDGVDLAGGLVRLGGGAFRLLLFGLTVFARVGFGGIRLGAVLLGRICFRFVIPVRLSWLRRTVGIGAVGGAGNPRG